jgi:predicted nucleic acid-binding protein
MTDGDPSALYLDSSAVLPAVLETGTTPDIERRIGAAEVLITSRLSLVETARSLLRLRQLGVVPEDRLADAARELELLWSRCEVWELTASVCDLAAHVAPLKPLRTLDALHLATYLLARRHLAGLSLLTADRRLQEAATAL